MQNAKRLELRKAIKAVNEAVPFGKDGGLENETFEVNGMKLIILNQENLTEILGQFCKAFIFNDGAGYPAQDDTYCLHRYRKEQLQKLAAADTYLDLDDSLKAYIKHEAVKLSQVLMEYTLEGW